MGRFGRLCKENAGLAAGLRAVRVFSATPIPAPWGPRLTGPRAHSSIHPFL